MKKREYIDEIFEFSYQKSLGPILTKLSTKYPWVKGNQFVQIQGHALFQGEIILKQRKYI